MRWDVVTLHQYCFFLFHISSNELEFRFFAQVRKHALSITNTLDIFKRSTLLNHNFVSGEYINIDDFYKNVERDVEKNVQVLLQSYRSLKPVLLKIESVVSETSCTGCSSYLSSYYFQVQMVVYNALSEVVVRSLATLRHLLLIHAHHQRTDSKWTGNLNTQLKNGEYIAQAARCTRLITSAPKRFIRWMNGTCSEAAIELDEDDILGLSQPPSISFYDSIARNQYIVGCVVTVYRDVTSSQNLGGRQPA